MSYSGRDIVNVAFVGAHYQLSINENSKILTTVGGV